ncbi:MAG: hypothetical protein GF355_04920 [Candidatus Eisenbacteria bacterium]|nr:hypothetical protein [Candidatus Eisenbacteria bacterium]
MGRELSAATRQPGRQLISPVAFSPFVCNILDLTWLLGISCSHMRSTARRLGTFMTRGGQSMATRTKRKEGKIWYRDGLQFSCTRCGQCCRDREDPTFVFLEEDDILRLAECLGVSGRRIIQGYTELTDDGYVLKRRNGACIFYDESIGCRIYPARPMQCRTWPFWPWNLRKEHWKEAAEFCPGCNQGKHHTRKQIESTARTMLGRRGEGSLWPGEIPIP